MKKNILLIVLSIQFCIVKSQVPTVYQNLYNTLESELNTADSLINSKWNGNSYCSDYYVDLKYANTTTYKTQLLQSSQLYRAKRAIDAFDSLGIHRVRLHAGYPFLVNSFPQSSDYLNFFIEVNNYARSKGLEVFIKSAITPNNSNYGAIDSTVNNFMTGKSRVDYLNEKLQMLQTIIDSLQPDYLTLENEPETMESATGLTFSFSPDSVKDMLNFYTVNLNNPNNIPLGAGAGNWEDLEYFSKIGEVSGIDFIDVHVYPVIFNCFSDRMIQVCDTIQAYSKNIVFGECWLYKQDIDDITAGTSALEIFKRDYFSFWEPLDTTFIAILSKYAQHYQANMITMWLMDRFFYYLDYQPGYEDSTANYLGSLSFAAINNNILNYNFTSTALAYKQLSDSACANTVEINPIDIEEIIIYPNPTNDFLTVIMPNNIEKVDFKIFNINGQQIRSGYLINDTTIDFLNFQNGIYILVWELQGTLIHKKIIKN